MIKDDAEQDKRQWHAAFLQAIKAELFDYREHLEFRHEYPLVTEPLRIDVLIIKKPKELVIDKNIARIFRTDNVVEYKSPEDYVSVKDFWKVCAYANLYAATTPGVDLADLTLTFVESRHSRKLLHYLTSVRGYTVQEPAPGIYLVTGDYLPIQIIESRKLSEDENFWLNSLRGDLERRSLNVIVAEGKKQGLETPLDAYMDVVLRANKRAYMEVDKMWQDTFIEICKENGTLDLVVEERLKGQEAEWKEEGRVQGKAEVVRNLLTRNMPIEDIAQVTELPVEKIRSLAAVH